MLTKYALVAVIVLCLTVLQKLSINRVGTAL